MAGLSDDEVFGTAQPKGMSDDEVFKSGLSDDEVFGAAPSLGSRVGQAAVRGLPVVGPALAVGGDYATEILKASTRGAGETIIAGPLQGQGAEQVTYETQLKLAREAPAFQQRMQQLLQEGTPFVDAYKVVNQEIEARRGQLATSSPADTGFYQAGQATSDFLQKGPLASKGILNPVIEDLATAGGSVGGNIATAAIPVVGPALAVGSTLSQGTGEAARRAVESKKATPAQQQQASQLGSAAGLTELADALLPQLGAPGKVAAFLGKAGPAAIRILEGALVEGGQEGLQQWLQNVIEKGTYNAEMNPMEGVLYNAFIGAVTGGGVSGVLGGQSRNAGGAQSPAQSQAAPSGVPSAAQLEESFNVLRGTPLEIPAANAVVASMMPQQAPMTATPVQAAGQAPLDATSTAVQPPAYQPQSEEARKAFTAGYARKEIAVNATPEMQEAWQQGALERTQKEMRAIPPPPDKYRGFTDTRGQGRRFMGAPTEVTLDTEGHYGSPTAIYGTSVTYTTEALDIAHGYANRRNAVQPTVYEVVEKRPTTLYDMDGEMSPEVRAKLASMLEDRYGETAELVEQGLDGTKTLREFFDAVRHYAAGNQTPANDVQEGVFHPVIDFLADQGFDGMSHLGGEKTKHPLHKVSIYFPQRDAIEIRRMDAKELETFKKAPDGTPTQEQVFKTPGPLRRLLAAPDLMAFSRIAKELNIAQNDPRFGAMLDEWMEARRMSGAMQKGSDITPIGVNVEAPRVSYSLGTSVVEGDYRPSFVYIPNNSIVNKAQGGPPALNGTIFSGTDAVVANYVSGRPLSVPTIHTAPLSSYLDDVQPAAEGGDVHNMIFQMFRERLKRLVGDTPVHIVLPGDLARLPGSDGGNTLGLTFTNKTLEPGALVKSNIVLRADLLADPRAFSHVFMHEGFHAVSAYALHVDTQLHNDTVQMVNALVRIMNQDPTKVPKRFQRTGTKYIFSSPDEFLAEAFSNAEFQHYLGNILVPQEVVTGLGLKNRPTFWQGFIQMLRRALGFEPSLEMYSFLEAALRIGTRVIDVQARLPFDTQRPELANYVIGVEENTNAIQREGGSKQLEGSARQPEVVGLSAMVHRAVGTGPTNAPHHATARAQSAHADRINWLYKIAAGLDQLTRANPNFVPLVAYKEGVVKMDGVSKTLQDGAVSIGKRWLGLGNQADNVASLMEDFVHMEFRSPAEKAANVVRMPTPQEFAKLVADNQVNAAGLKVFNDVKIFSDGLHNLIERSLIQRVSNKVMDPALRAKRIQTIQQKAALLRQRPYFPFTNFGSHYILVQDPSGTLVHFQTYERQGLKRAAHVQSNAAKSWAREWEKQYGRPPVMGTDIKVGVLPEHVKPMVGMPSMLLEEMADVMQLTEEQINAAQWLTLAEAAGDAPMLRSGAQKMFYKPRYGFKVPGYSMDLRRSFSQFAFHGSKYFSRIEHLDGLRTAIKAAENIPDVKANEIAKFMQNHLEKTVLDARGDFGNIRGAMFFFALGYVPQAATQNMFQTPMLTFPFLWDKFGLFKSKLAISKAAVRLKDFYHRAKYNDQQLSAPFWERATHYGIRTGRLKETMAAELVGMSQSSLLQGVGGNRTHRYWRNFVENAAFMFETIEQYNRWIAFHASLELAEKNPNAAYIDEAIKEHPVEYQELRATYSDAQARALIAAINATEQTQFNYSRVMRPKLFRGPVGATVFIFKNFMRSTLWTLGHNPTMVWKYALIAGLLGGLSGLPFAEEIYDIIKLIGRFFGKEWDVEKEVRKLVRDYLSEVVQADILLHGFARRGFGVPALLDLMGSFATGTPGRGLAAPRYEVNPETGHAQKVGFNHNVPFPVLDRSRAISMGQVLPFDLGAVLGATDDPNRTIAVQAQQASGAVFSLAFNMYRMFADTHLSWGDAKKYEKVIPAQLGNMSKAWRAYNEGRERTRGGPNGGTTVVPYDVRDPEQMMEILAIALGYRPVRETARWDVTMRKMEAEKHMQLKRTGLQEAFYEAVSGGSDEEVDIVLGQVEKFNSELPEEWSGMSLSGKSLQDSATQRFRGRTMREMGIPKIRGARPGAQDLESLYPEASTDVSTPIRR